MSIISYAQLFIPGPLPGENELLDARVRLSPAQPGKTKRHNGYSDLKRKWTSEVQTLAMLARLRPGQIPAAHFTFLHYEIDKLRDPDNFCGGAQKLLFDALKCAGLIENDGWRHVLGIRHHWLCSPAVGGHQVVGVQLYAASDCLSLEQAEVHAKPLRRRVELIQRVQLKRKPSAPRPKRAASVFG